MNWENSRALTPLKRDFLKLFFERTQSFYLTGGSALGIFYIEHRVSYDLDFFTQEEVNWHLLQNIVQSVSKEIAAEYRAITASPHFYRFELSRGGEREILDFVIERAPQIDPEKEHFGRIRVDTLREIAVNKVCTLVGRNELKDLVDLYFLSKRGFNATALLDEARKKEGGLDPAMISFLLSQVTVDRIPEYVIVPLDVAELKTFIRKLQEDLGRLSFPGEAGGREPPAS